MKSPQYTAFCVHTMSMAKNKGVDEDRGKLVYLDFMDLNPKKKYAELVTGVDATKRLESPRPWSQV